MFTDEFKKYIVNEVESGRITRMKAMRKYNILGHSTILKWRRVYGNLQLKNTQKKVHYIKMNDDDKVLIRLNNEIKELNRELETARMKNVIMETAIDIAEKELSIPIRKKYGIKQSEK
jgi:transposase